MVSANATLFHIPHFDSRLLLASLARHSRAGEVPARHSRAGGVFGSSFPRRRESRERLTRLKLVAVLPRGRRFWLDCQAWGCKSRAIPEVLARHSRAAGVFGSIARREGARVDQSRRRGHWIPACAGMTEGGATGFPRGWRFWRVIPAQAGIQGTVNSSKACCCSSARPAFFARLPGVRVQELVNPGGAATGFPPARE